MVTVQWYRGQKYLPCIWATKRAYNHTRKSRSVEDEMDGRLSSFCGLYLWICKWKEDAEYRVCKNRTAKCHLPHPDTYSKYKNAGWKNRSIRNCATAKREQKKQSYYSADRRRADTGQWIWPAFYRSGRTVCGRILSFWTSLWNLYQKSER